MKTRSDPRYDCRSIYFNYYGTPDYFVTSDVLTI